MKNSRMVRRASSASFIALLIILTFPHLSQAQILRGPYIESASPTFNYVDPRQPQGTAAGAPAQGIDTLTVTFSEPVGDLVAWSTPEILEPLSKENFELAFYKSGQWIENADLTLHSSPIINSVTGSGRGPYTLSLSQRVPLGTWTVLYPKDIVGQSGNLLVASNGAIRLILGNRPMDIDGNGLHSFSDWVRWRSYAQGTLSPAPMALVDYLDIDRSGSLSLPGLLSDTFRARQLLDGPPPLQAWKAYDMGPKPPADCATNVPPQAIFTYRQTTPSSYDFDAAASLDTSEIGWPGYIAGFRWTINGIQSNWLYFSDMAYFHQSNEPFSVTLTVMDYCGATAENTLVVTPSPIVPLTINGTVLFSGGPAIGVPVNAQSNTASFQDTTDAQGNYSITISGNNAYTVTPSFNGYSFTPSGFTNPVTVNGQPRQGINFTVTENLTSPTATRLTDYSLGSAPVRNISQYPKPISFNGRLYFIANLDNAGYEIWSTDGSTNSTVRLKDIYPGADSPWIDSWVVAGNYLYFNADDRIHGAELWRTNGTESGTVMVTDIADGSFPSLVAELTAVGNTVYFLAWDGDNNLNLWKTDGTEAGTMIVKAFVPQGPSEPYNLTNVNGTLYFTASTPNNGEELWKSNGTSVGTVLVKDILPGASGAAPNSLTAIGNLIFFLADNGTNGTELWKSDGTASGTVLVQDINPGSSGSKAEQLTNVNGLLYFVADNGVDGLELWKSNGTTAGTSLVKDISTSASKISNLTNVNGRLFFRASSTQAGIELWTSDGTASGTILVKDLFPGVGTSSPYNFVSYNNALYFSAYDATAGRELWKSDGTDAGTVVVRDLAPGKQSSYPGFPVVVNTKLYFQTGIDEVLWISDGTANGSNIVKIPGEWSSLTMEMVPLVSSLLFEGNLDSAGEELWKTSGTTQTTARVKDIFPGALGGDFSDCVSIALVAYCAANDGTTGVELWKTDGSQAGTVLLKDINPGSAGSYPAQFTNVNGIIFFTADDGASGIELWKTDGTPAGTNRIKDIVAGVWDSSPYQLTAANGTLFFAVNDYVKGSELWRSNGTETGTEIVADIYPGSRGSNPSELTEMNGLVYFMAEDESTGYELWKSNGTTAGTTRVIDLLPGVDSSIPTSLVSMNGALYFIGHNSPNTSGAWKTNGTAVGTERLFDPAANNFPAGPLVPMNGKLYFSQFDYDNGANLWVSDGTLAGTTIVRDLIPGAPDLLDPNFRLDTGPKNLTAAGSNLFFIFDDGISGLELWKSDGTSAGTVMIQNINPGPAPSSPRNLTAVRNNLYFVAHDGTRGYELWKY